MFQCIEGKLIPDEKMFRPISADKLIIDTKYIIGDGYSAIYKGPYLYKDYTYRRFEQIYDIIEEKHPLQQVSYGVEFSKYYEFVSQQPQWKMERRAVNLIIRELTGDDCFEW